MHQRSKDRQNGGFPQPLYDHPDAQRWLKPRGVAAVDTLSRQNRTEKVPSARALRKELLLKKDKSAQDLAVLSKCHQILASHDAHDEKVASARAFRNELHLKKDKSAEDVAELKKCNQILASQDARVEKVASARALRKELHLKTDKSAEDLAELKKCNEILASDDARVEKLACARLHRRQLRSKENKTAEDLEALGKFNQMLARQDGHYRRLAEIRAKMDGAEELEDWEVSLLEEDRIYEEQLRAHKLWLAQEFAVQHGHARPRYEVIQQ
jgi:muconolactone delta-isomerase